MKKVINPAQNTWKELAIRSIETYDYLEKTVKPILRAVRRSGDKALRRYVKKFDKVNVKDFLVTDEEIRQAQTQVNDDLKKAIQAAKYNIAQFHLAQKVQLKKIQTTEGIHCWQKNIPIDKVGLYIPSRHAPLFSTILMLGIPANIAGCDDIILCSSPSANGNLHPVTLYTANLLNIKRIYKIGGVQAIAAMAYGTESIPKVDKIFGPSNQYVTAAKQVVGKSEVAMDLPSGPTELVIMADESANPTFVAADIVANAEQTHNSQSVLVTTSEDFCNAVLKEINQQINQSQRQDIVKQSLQSARAIVLENNQKAIDFINEYAPENLILAVANDEVVAEKIINAGAVYLGNYSPEVAGSYGTGPNNTLPTNQYTRAYSGVSVDSFVKKVNFHKITDKGLKNYGEKIETMATAEEMFGRKNAITVRLKEINS